MCKINLISLLALSLMVSACGGGGGSSSPKPTSSAAKISSSSKVSSSITSSSIAPSSSAPSSTTTTTSSTAISSASSSSVYSANVDHLRDLATFPIGVAVSNTDSPSYNILTNASEKAVAEKHFDQMTAGNIMKVSYLHPDLNTFSFTNADAFVDYAKSKNISVHGHALIWHSGYQVPNFMKNWSNSDSAGFSTMLDTHVTTIVDHFEATNNIVSWDVVNEAIDDEDPANFRDDSPFYVKSGNSAIYIEKAFLAARAADANVDLYYNDYSIELNGPKMDKVIAMLEDFKSRTVPIPITGIGFQMHVYLNFPSIENISAAMQRVVDLGYKVKISELDVSINNPFTTGWSVSTATPYDGLAQKKRYCEIVKAYIDTVPEELRGGITVWGTTDANTWLDLFYKEIGKTNGEPVAWPLLFDNQYNDKPALRGFADGLTGTACTNL